MTRHHPHANERRPPTLVDQTADLGLFAPIVETPTPSEAVARAIATAKHKYKNPELVAKLRTAARLAYDRLQRPISTNDVRDVLEREGKGIDRRVMAIVFAESYWTAFGTTQTDCKNATVARVGITRATIRTYVPTHLVAMWAAKAEDERRTA